jgi:short-subunit dehydrogenase
MNAGLVAITGAARGIGEALAREAVSRGHRVALFDRDEAALEVLRARLGPDQCVICAGDVTSDSDLTRFKNLITSQADPLRMVFANAGILRAGEVLGLDVAELEQMFAVNVYGTIRTAQSLVPLMQVQTEASLFVVTGSTSMLAAGAGFGGYAASKHALLALTEALDAELLRAGSPVRAALLCPAAVQTGIADGSSDLLSKLKRRMTTHGITPDQMAQIAFDELASGLSVVFSSDGTKAIARDRLQALLSGYFMNSRSAPETGSH